MHNCFIFRILFNLAGEYILPKVWFLELIPPHKTLCLFLALPVNVSQAKTFSRFSSLFLLFWLIFISFFPFLLHFPYNLFSLNLKSLRGRGGGWSKSIFRYLAIWTTKVLRGGGQCFNGRTIKKKCVRLPKCHGFSIELVRWVLAIF